MTLPKYHLRKIYGITKSADPADPAVFARTRYHEAAAKWLAEWLAPLQAVFASLGFFIILLPVLSKPWRSIIEGLPILSKIFLDYSTFSGLAIINFYALLFTALTKLWLAKHSPSGDVIPSRDAIAPLLCPRTRKEEVSFWIESVGMILCTSVWLFLPFGVLGYFISIGR